MITLSGIPYKAVSPSLLHAANQPITLAYIGRPCRADSPRYSEAVAGASGEGGWLIAVRGVYGLREFATRDEAAALIAQAFMNARENLG